MAFITGSHAYGQPSHKSDVDLVVLMSPADAEKIRELSDTKVPVTRFGKLNLIICTSEDEYASWKVGTQVLKMKRAKERKPVRRTKAKGMLDKIRKAMGLGYYDKSPSD